MRPYLRVANVFEDRIDTSDVQSMNFTPREHEIYGLQPADVLLNEGQSLELVGRAALYRGEVPGACFQNTLIRFRAYPAVLPAYALLVFRHYLHAGVFQRIARWTTSIAHLGAARLSAMPFPVPPLQEQQRIVDALDERPTELDAGMDALKRGRANLKRYRASVLQAACEGRLVPGEAELARQERRNYEPAEGLLERIRGPGVRATEGRRRNAAARHASPADDRRPAFAEGWTWTTVEELSDPSRPIAYGVLQPGDEVHGGVPLVRVGDIGHGNVSLAGLKHVDPSVALREE